MAKPVKHYGKWRIRWLDEHGQRQSEVYECHRDAEFALRRHENRVEEVSRGLRPSLSLNKTFADLCDEYLLKRSVLKRRQCDDESIIRNHLRPFFGECKLGQVNDRVDDFKASQTHYHPNTLHHHLTLLISMLRYAQEKHWLIEVPRIKKPRLRLFDKDFHYLRNEDEIRRFLAAAQAEGPKIHSLYSLAVYTGTRPGEQAGLQKADISFETRLITIQRSFASPTKNGEVRYVPILDPLLPTLREWMIACPGPLLFPNEQGGMLGDRARAFDEIFKRVLERAGFPKVEKRGKLLPYIRYYDLRHTFASTWVRNGGNIFKLSKILGHNSVQMTMRYSHLQPDAYTEDYGRLGKPISHGGSVIQLPLASPHPK